MTDITAPDELLTLDEVAALTKLTKPLLTKYLRDEACPLQEVRAGRYIRVRRSSYDRWLAWLAA